MEGSRGQSVWGLGEKPSQEDTLPDSPADMCATHVCCGSSWKYALPRTWPSAGWCHGPLWGTWEQSTNKARSLVVPLPSLVHDSWLDQEPEMRSLENTPPLRSAPEWTPGSLYQPRKTLPGVSMSPSTRQAVSFGAVQKEEENNLNGVTQGFSASLDAHRTSPPRARHVPAEAPSLVLSSLGQSMPRGPGSIRTVLETSVLVHVYVVWGSGMLMQCRPL